MNDLIVAGIMRSLAKTLALVGLACFMAGGLLAFIIFKLVSP